MQYLAMQTHDIRTNLATEEYLMNSGVMTPPFITVVNMELRLPGGCPVAVRCIKI